jgi:hypothetical protein
MKATTHPGWTVQRGQGATSVTCCQSEMARSNGPETSILSKKDAKGWSPYVLCTSVGPPQPPRGLSERGAAVGGSVAGRTVVTHLSCAEVRTAAAAAAAGGDVM